MELHSWKSVKTNLAIANPVSVSLIDSGALLKIDKLNLRIY